MPEPVQTITLGKARVPVVAQRHARLRRKLDGADFQALLSGDYSHEAYRVLGVLIPELPKQVKEWEWDGFANEAEWKKWRETGKDPRSDEAADEEDNLSPTSDELVNAFETALKVSGAQRLGKLVDLVKTGMSLADRAPSVPDSPTPDSPALPGATGA